MVKGDERWSRARIASGVKMAFWREMMASDRDIDHTWLTYTYLHRAVSTPSSTPPHKTFSAALASLRREGFLEREQVARRARYRLRMKFSESDVAAAVATYDVHRIESASKVGSVGDLSAGWTIHGVHPASPHSFQRNLVAACKAAQADLVQAAVEEAKTLARTILSTVRGKLERHHHAVLRDYLDWAIDFRIALGSPFAQMGHMKSLDRLFGPELLGLVGEILPGAVRRFGVEKEVKVKKWWKPALAVWQSPEVVVRGLGTLFTAPGSMPENEMKTFKRELRRRRISFARLSRYAQRWMSLMVSFSPTVVVSAAYHVRGVDRDLARALDEEGRLLAESRSR